jgi:spermidine synthase
MLIIFCFQVVYGYIYLKIGAIITAFLSGLLPGAIIGNTYRGRPRANLIFSETALFALLLLFFFWLDFHRHSPHPFYFLIYGFAFAFFCGFQFPAATSMIGEKKSPAAGCIAADLAGAAAGTLITGTLLIPLWGIRSAIIFLLLMKISSNMIILFGKAR